jgi:uncharacterized membrane protein
MAEVMYGPMQILVIGFKDPEFHGQIYRALKSVLEEGVIRVIDLRFVWKDEDGKIRAMQESQLDEEERMRFGTALGGLIGLGAAGEEGARAGMERGAMAAAERTYGMTEKNVQELAEAMPNNTAAAFFLIEHLWAKDLKQALRDAGGFLIGEGMLTPEALIKMGGRLRAAVEAAEAQSPTAATAR